MINMQHFVQFAIMLCGWLIYLAKRNRLSVINTIFLLFKILKKEEVSRRLEAVRFCAQG